MYDVLVSKFLNSELQYLRHHSSKLRNSISSCKSNGAECRDIRGSPAALHYNLLSGLLCNRRLRPSKMCFVFCNQWAVGFAFGRRLHTIKFGVPTDARASLERCYSASWVFLCLFNLEGKHSLQMLNGCRDSVRIANRYGRRIENRWGENFCPRPHRLWVPPSFLQIAYGVKAVGTWSWSLTFT